MKTTLRLRLLATLATLPALLALLPSAALAQIIYTGGAIGSGNGTGGAGSTNTILVSTGTTTSVYTYQYTDASGAIVTGTKTTGSPQTRTGATAGVAISISPASVAAGYTIKSADSSGAVWAVIDGGTDNPTSRQLIAITETPGQALTLNLNNVIIQNGFLGGTSSVGAGMSIKGSAGALDGTIKGDVVFRGNYASSAGGAINMGSAGLTFAGNVTFDSNRAGADASGIAPASANARVGGAISFGGVGNSGQLIFGGAAIFVNNMALWGNGGAIAGSNVSPTFERAIKFYGNAIFDGNYAGVTAGNANGIGAAALTTGGHGGAIMATQGMSLAFYDSVSFNGNVSGGFGGAIYVRDRDLTFTDDPDPARGTPNATSPALYPYTLYNGNRLFSFTRNVSASTAGGGGAIMLDQSISSTGAVPSRYPHGAVTFNAANSIASFTGNATAASGGAIHVNGGGIYLDNGTFLFQGNQSIGGGGALYNGNLTSLTTAGNMRPAGRDYRIEIHATATFNNNATQGSGGAIQATVTLPTTIAVGNITPDNITTDNAVYIGADKPGSSITFSNNYAGAKGGALYIDQSGTMLGSALTLNAANGDITFTGNRSAVPTDNPLTIANALRIATGDARGYMTVTSASGAPNDVYLNSPNLTVNMNVAAGRAIYFDGGFASSSASNVENINITGAPGGSVIFDRQTGTATVVNIMNFAARTNLAGGALLLKNNVTYGAGAATTTVASGATIGGSGTFTGATTIAAGAKVNIGDLNSTTPQTLTLAGNAAIGGPGTPTTLYYDLLGNPGPAATPTYDQLKVTATLTLAGPQTLDLTGIGIGAYTLITAGNLAATGVTYALQSNGVPLTSLTSRYTYTAPVLTPTTLTISTSMANMLVNWTGAATNLWQDSLGANWNAPAATAEKYYRNGDSVTIAPAGGAASSAIAITPVGVTAADVTGTIPAGTTITLTGGPITTTNSATATTLATATGKFTKTGPGTLAFANATGTANLFTNGLYLAGGTVTFTDGAQLTTGPAATIDFTGQATLVPLTTGTQTIASTLTIDPGATATLQTTANTLRLANTLAGAGALVKTGPGILTLAANSSAFAGSATIAAGSLNLEPVSTLGGALKLANATTLTGSGTATGSVTASAGSNIKPNATGVVSGAAGQTLTLNNLTLANATLTLGLYAPATGGYGDSDHVNATGATLALTGTNTIDIFGNIQNGTYLLGANLAPLASTGATTNVYLGGEAVIPGARKTATLATAGANLVLNTIVDDSRLVTWTAAAATTATGQWNLSSDNWTAAGSTAKKFGGGDHVIFNNTGAAHNNVFIAGAGQQGVSDITIAGTATYTFTGQGIYASIDNLVIGSTTGLVPTGKLYKQDAGTLVFNNAPNSFTGGIQVTGGAISFNNPAQLSTLDTTTGTDAGIAFAATGGTLRAAADAMTLSSARITIAPGATGAIDIGATTTLITQTTAAATGTDAPVVTTSTLVTPNTLTLTSTLAGAGALAKTGPGILVYNGDATTFTGTAAVREGTLLLDNVTLAGNATVAPNSTLVGTGTIAGAATVATGGTLCAGMNDNTAQILAIASLTLANGAVLTAGGTGATGELDGAIALATGGTARIDIAASGTLTLAASIKGSGSIEKTGPGTAILTSTAALGYTGLTTLTGGTLALAGLTAADAAAFAKPLDLNGGWLLLASNTTPFNAANPAAAYVWNNLPPGAIYTGTDPVNDGGIAGTNDLFNLAAGAYPYPFAGGIFLIADPGPTGTVALSGASSHNGSTQIKSGILDISSPTALGSGAATNTLIFNGGNLTVSATAGNIGVATRPTELRTSATINVLTPGITFTAGVMSETGGAWTLTKTGDGILAVAGASTRTGTTALNAGGISFLTTTSPLGAGPIAITGTGTQLISGAGNGTANLDISNPIALNQYTLTLNTLATTSTYSGPITGSGGILKTANLSAANSYYAVFTNQNKTYTGTTTIYSGGLRAGNENAFSPASDIVLSSTSYQSSPVLDLNGFNQSVGDIFTSNMAVGSGTATAGYTFILMKGAALTLKNGAGTLVNGGILAINSVVPNGVNNGGQPYFVTGTSVPAGAIVPGVSAVIHGNYVGQVGVSGTLTAFYRPPAIVAGIALDNTTGHVTAYDTLLIDGSVSGLTNLNVFVTGSLVTTVPQSQDALALPITIVPSVPSIISDMAGRAIITASGTMAPGSFAPAIYPYRVVDMNGNQIVPVQAGNRVLLGASLAPELPGALAINAATYLIGKTAIDSLSQRLGDLRLDNADFKHGMDLWIHGLYANDRIRTGYYDGASDTTGGAQVGIDYTTADKGRRFTLGGFADYLQATVHQSNAVGTRAEIYGFGVYGTLQQGRFSFDALFRASQDKYNVTVPDSGGFSMPGTSVGGSVQASYLLTIAQKWNLEPQLQAAAHRHNTSHGTDSLGRIYGVKTFDSLTYRAGLLLWRGFTTRTGVIWMPRVRLSIVDETEGKGRLTVGTTQITDDFGGTYAQYEAGLTVRLTKFTDIGANLMYYAGNKYSTLASNAAITFRW